MKQHNIISQLYQDYDHKLYCPSACIYFSTTQAIQVYFEIFINSVLICCQKQPSKNNFMIGRSITTPSMINLEDFKPISNMYDRYGQQERMCIYESSCIDRKPDPRANFCQLLRTVYHELKPALRLSSIHCRCLSIFVCLHTDGHDYLQETYDHFNQHSRI